MHTGGCLCGTVRYELRGELGPAYFCHCGRCRKANGSAFATNAVVAADDFAVVAGMDALGCYSTDAGLDRHFCTRCGSPIISRRDAQPEIVRLRIGTLDAPPSTRPIGHIFVASKAPWDLICDDLPQYDERPPAS